MNCWRIHVNPHQFKTQRLEMNHISSLSRIASKAKLLRTSHSTSIVLYWASVPQTYALSPLSQERREARDERTGVYQLPAQQRATILMKYLFTSKVALWLQNFLKLIVVDCRNQLKSGNRCRNSSEHNVDKQSSLRYSHLKCYNGSKIF